jgi:membrane-associated HD superfamily phosphohydrolase
MDTVRKLGSITWIKTTALILLAAVFFPFVIHLIPPHNGFSIGAYLLPMFYIPFIALFWYDWKVALPIAVLAPLINFTITGNPQWGFLVVLTLELVLFTGIAFLLLNHKTLKWIAAPFGYIGAKIISSLLLFVIPIMPAAPMEFFLGSLSRALPGIGILLLLNFLLLKYGNPSLKISK